MHSWLPGRFHRVLHKKRAHYWATIVVVQSFIDVLRERIYEDCSAGSYDSIKFRFDMLNTAF